MQTFAQYEVVKTHIRTLIASGDLPVGATVPSESELVHQFGVARMTVGRALKDLAEAGVITRSQGRRSTVASPIPHGHPIHIHNLADEIRARGHEHTFRTIRLISRAANRGEAERLGMHPGDELVHCILVHFEDAVPLQLEDRVIRTAHVPHCMRALARGVTPHEHLMRVAPLQRAEHILCAGLPNKTQARLLGIKPCEPCLILSRTTWSENQIVSHARFHYPASRYRFAASFDVAPPPQMSEASRDKRLQPS